MTRQKKIVAADEQQHERPPLPDFTPVPRKYRFDGWTPERQRAFIEALADTGCVSRAARMVNMAQANCYTLRRAPGAEGFRRAWDAALDLGVKRLKDIAFERAIEGYQVPVFVGGKLMGFRRKHNDALLMFCLRHYGQDGEGKRTTINYFSTRASAGAGAASAGAAGRPATLRPGSGQASLGTNEAGAVAQASATTVRTVIAGPAGAGAAKGAARDDEAAEVLNGFEGVALDAEAEAAIRAALEDCAARARAAEAEYDQGGQAAFEAGLDDPDNPFVRTVPGRLEWRGSLEPVVTFEDHEPLIEGEAPWSLAGLEMPEERARIEDEWGRRKAGLLEAGPEGEAPAG